eukprot:752687-Hanusia_phi.AAC.3
MYRHWKGIKRGVVMFREGGETFVRKKRRERWRREGEDIGEEGSKDECAPEEGGNRAYWASREVHEPTKESCLIDHGKT